MPYQQTTWAELRQRLADRYDGVPFWTEADALAAVNEGLQLWNLCTGRWRTRATLLSIAAQVRYTAPATLLQHARVLFENYPLSASTRFDLAHIRPTWRTETTLSGGAVPTRPTVWIPVSLRSFDIWPADGVATNFHFLVDGVAATPVVTTDASFLDLGAEHLDRLLGYALHVLTFSKGGAFFQATQSLFTAFLAAAAEENSQIVGSLVFRRLLGLDMRGLQPLRGSPTRFEAVVSGQGTP